jgi:hypothetical protein
MPRISKAYSKSFLLLSTPNTSDIERQTIRKERRIKVSIAINTSFGKQELSPCLAILLFSP